MIFTRINNLRECYVYFTQLNKKLETAESCVETLNAQLQAMGQSDSLSRARQQHEAIVNSLTQKMDSELNTLREKLDIAEKDRDEKVSNFLTLLLSYVLLCCFLGSYNLN